MGRWASRSKALLLALLVAGGALACAPDAGMPVAVAGVAPGGDIALSDGRTIRLSGLDWPGRERRRERERLVAGLQAMLTGEAVVLVVRGGADRWGRIAGDLFVLRRGGRAPLWVQGEMVEDGFVRLWPEAAARTCLADLKEREQLARQGGLGLWAALAQRPPQRRLPAQARMPISRRIVYEGVVHSVRRGRVVTFVNFVGPRGSTPSWLIGRRLAADLARSGRDPATFAGKRLILRAEFAAAPRPTLTVTLPEAVDVLE